MHIRKLEIHGFKSFCDRQVFHFGPGISGVVGPNGCGKSNVVDAVKWCLGEQSAKSLRGGTMTDVIFAGTQERSAQGIAEVSLTFVAEDEPFPGEYARNAELQVTRRLFRDGKAEYRINGSRCRLRDIQDIFLDTGANNRMYSFIEQGRIGQIIGAKPEQRRALIEEAAGISRYKARKDDAEKKLAGTLDNLEQASRTIDDLAGRLRSLERQVRRAVKYRRLRSRIKQGEIFLGLARFSGLVGDRRALSGSMRDAEAEEARAIRDVTLREQAISKGRQSLQELEEQAGKLRDELAELEATRRESESARGFQAREQEELGRRVTALDADASTATTQATAARARLDEARRASQQVSARLAGLEDELKVARQQAQAAESALRERRRRIDATKNQVLQQVQRVAKDRAAFESAGHRQGDLTQRRTALLARQAEVGTGVAGFEASVAEATANEASAGELAAATRQALDAARQAETLVAQKRKQAQQEVSQAGRAVDARNRDLAAAERALGSLQARIESLEALQASHAGVDDAVRQVLGHDGVLGTLAEHLDVPAELEAALSVALGSSLDLALAPEDEIVVSALGTAPDGRVGVMPVDGASPAPSEFVKRFGGSEHGRRALARLLAGCRIAADLPTALALWRDEGDPVVVLGEQPAFVSAAGVVTVGAAGSAGAAALSRRREIARLQPQTEAAQAMVDECVAAVEEAQTALEAARQAEAAASSEQDQARQAIDTARSAASETELALRVAQRERLDAERSRASEQARQARLGDELKTLEGQLQDLVKRRDDLAQALETGQAAQVDAEEALLKDQAGLAAEEAAVSAARGALGSFASETAALRERHLSLKREETVATAQAEEADARALASRAQIEEAKARITQLIGDDARLVEILADVKARQVTAGEQLAAARARVAESRQAIAAEEEELRGARELRQEASGHRASLDRQLAQVKTDIAHIRDSLEDRHDVSAAGLIDRLDRVGHLVVAAEQGAHTVLGPDDAGDVEDLRLTRADLDDADQVAQWVEQLQGDRTGLERLGEVNLMAQQEYDEVLERHDGLDARRADLEESVRAIRQTIGMLNRTCRERFRDTFDRVNAYFQEIYPRLVGGGQARLLLTDEEDLLESGVDIMVQPPGKKLQQLTLLSGGEMAMTAIALIFSLFRVKPSPFCLLDEVDAPLDEGNGARFNQTLREMAKLSQFIVITHNKKTMECADTLYGVTMAVPGVSRLVSVQLD